MADAEPLVRTAVAVADTVAAAAAAVPSTIAERIGRTGTAHM